MSEEALTRRQIVIEATADRLSIKSEKRSTGLFSRFFGSEAHEKVTLKLPRQISLHTKGVNGSVNVGAIDGSVEVAGVNGRVEIASATGSASFSGINGNVLVALTRLDGEGITLKGINGNRIAVAGEREREPRGEGHEWTSRFQCTVGFG